MYRRDAWRLLLLVALLTALTTATSVFFVDDDDQTLAFPIQNNGVTHLESDILDMLGLADPPEHISTSSSSKENAANAFMRRLYTSLEHPEESSSRQRTLPSEVSTADLVVSLVPKDIEKTELLEDAWSLQFRAEDLPKGTGVHLTGAHLFFVPKGQSPSRLAVYQSRSGSLNRIATWLSMGGSTGPSEIRLNISSLVEQWANDGARAEILLQAEPASPRGVGKDWEAFVIASFDAPARLRPSSSRKPAAGGEAKKRRRVKRSTESHPRPPAPETPRTNPLRGRYRHHRSLCRRHGLYVDFKDMGWKDWVIAPEGYQAHYCVGACSFPLSADLNATNHAIVQTLVHLTNHKRAGEAKCAPVSVTHMTILFLDSDENIQMKRYKDMIVQDCGCQ